MFFAMVAGRSKACEGKPRIYGRVINSNNAASTWRGLLKR
jgi:hypothetical protein